ncbi:MAG: DinB family protein [Halocynthiibacter sp.]
MITPGYVHTMARYNLWQNKEMLAIVGSLPKEERQKNRGSFFGSIEATLYHLLWGDRIWMSRFDGWDVPKGQIAESVEFARGWSSYLIERRDADRKILHWSEGLSEEDLSWELVWHSHAMGQEVSRPLSLCITHFINHQTHHRGQIHAMISACGVKPHISDLFFMPDKD